ncbi:metallophosphoesterase [Telluribacter sp. SYSU D00476]|uniref:metallophosphoesterase n=1 Tax=Telluribacter sp. SYSU D00476 TaxID=2811430 RepID=UPI001FF63916|nr:metallophosphoesterase [Telluribacter sp. SYSU D00476]
MNKPIQRVVLSAALTGTALFLLDALFLEKHFFQVNRFRIGNLHSAQRPIHLLQLSDLHLRAPLANTCFRLQATVSQLQPDLILFTGDSIDAKGDISALREFLDLLDRNIPKAAILGNHEYVAEVDIDALKKLYAQYNGTLLINKSKAYQIRGERIMVTGLDDLLYGENDIEKAFEGVGGEKNHLVLIHSPMHQEDLKKALQIMNAQREPQDTISVQYLFAGHNHGGQVTLLGRFVPYMPAKAGKYLKGWYNAEPPYLYLSKGFGTSTVPFRFGARAEITSFLYYT